MIMLPAFISDGMVIGKQARIWGTATPGLEIKLEFLSKTYATVADAAGRFEFNLSSPEYGGPHTMTIGDRAIRDVYIGRLWFCGGQSNMEWPLHGVTELLGSHIREDKRIRAFQVEKDLKFDGPAENVKGKWHTATGDFLQHLYAVPYFFARALLETEKDIPIGLLNVAAGGTSIEAWLPEEIIKEYPELYTRLEEVRAPGYMERLIGEAEAAGTEPPWFYTHPCCVYNHMLAPVLGVKPDGVIWYQGESNVGNPPMYKPLFTRFVELMRKYCGEDLPIIFTQLANFLDVACSVEVSEIWPRLREAQRQCLSIPNTAMAVIIDCGEEYDIHPRDKKTVGERLALHAKKMVYGYEIITDGPVFSHITLHGDHMAIHFNNAQGLWAKNGRPLVDLVAKDGTVHRLYAAVEKQTLIIKTGGLDVKKVRFGWTDCPPVTLYNAHNLPASPFEEVIA
jgi:sialate O-acetylesterase